MENFSLYTGQTAHLLAEKAYFGNLRDRYSKRIITCDEWDFVAKSARFPVETFVAATPARITDHIACLPDAIDPSSNPEGALVATPVYRQSDDGHLTGSQLIITRIHPGTLPSAGQWNMQDAQSVAVMLGWFDYARYVPRLAMGLSALAVEAQTNATSRTERMTRTPMQLELCPEWDTALDKNSQRAARIIVGAILSGHKLRLNKHWFVNEEDFLRCLFAALAYLPETCRAHVSFSSGLYWPDDDIQIAWAYEAEGVNPEAPVCCDLDLLGVRIMHAQPGGDISMPTMSLPKTGNGLVMATGAPSCLHRRIRNQLAFALSQHYLPSHGPESKVVIPAIQKAYARLAQVPKPLSSDEDVRREEHLPKELVAFAKLADAADQPLSASQKHRYASIFKAQFAHWLQGKFCLPRRDVQVIAYSEVLRSWVRDLAEDDNTEVRIKLRYSMAIFVKALGRNVPLIQKLASALIPKTADMQTPWQKALFADPDAEHLIYQAKTDLLSVDRDAFQFAIDQLVEQNRPDLLRRAMLSLSQMECQDTALEELRRLSFLADTRRSEENAILAQEHAAKSFSQSHVPYLRLVK